MAPRLGKTKHGDRHLGRDQPVFDFRIRFPYSIAVFENRRARFIAQQVLPVFWSAHPFATRIGDPPPLFRPSVLVAIRDKVKFG